MWHKKFSGIARELGFGNAVLYVINRIGERLLGGRFSVFKIHFVVHVLPETAAAPRVRKGRMDIRHLRTDEAVAAGISFPEPLIESRMADEAWCVAAFMDDRVVGYRWMQLTPHRDEELRCRFVPEPAGRVAWCWNFYIDPKYRGTRVFTRLWDETFVLVRKLGAKGTVSWGSALTPRLLAAESKLGAKEIGRALIWRLGPWQLLIGNLPPRIHFSVHDGACPSIRLTLPQTGQTGISETVETTHTATPTPAPEQP